MAAVIAVSIMSEPIAIDEPFQKPIGSRRCFPKVHVGLSLVIIETANNREFFVQGRSFAVDHKRIESLNDQQPGPRSPATAMIRGFEPTR